MYVHILSILKCNILIYTINRPRANIENKLSERFARCYLVAILHVTTKTISPQTCDEALVLFRNDTIILSICLAIYFDVFVA